MIGLDIASLEVFLVSVTDFVSLEKRFFVSPGWGFRFTLVVVYLGMDRWAS